MSTIEIASRINTLLPARSYLATGNISDLKNNATQFESRYIARSSYSRKMEFIAGRSIAREAAKHLGFEIGSISPGRNGCPVWPEPIVGSISHKSGFCGALIGYRDTYFSLGLDIELVENLQKDVWKTFATTEEIEQSKNCGVEATEFANLIFSAKEAYFKCLYPLYEELTPVFSDIRVATNLVDRNYLETQITYKNSGLYGGIISDSEIVISWAIMEKL